MREHTPEILNLITVPAFTVCNGIIKHCNEAAQKLLISPETPIASLLPQNHSEYIAFQDGCLYLTLKLHDQTYSASVTPVDDVHIFAIDEDHNQTELKTLSLTAFNMRQPLSSMIATTNTLSDALADNKDPKVRAQLQHMNRNLCRMHRMLCNMSDAIQYADGHSNNMVCQNIVSVVESIFQKAQQHCQEIGIPLEYTIPDQSVLCVIDEPLLERGIYNMLSNAIKFSEPGSVIQASFTYRNNRVYISIKDSGNGIPASILGSIFQRYQRQPGLEDGRHGLGLGLMMVRCAARVHNGTVLVDQPDHVGTRITVSFPVQYSSSAFLRSDVTRVDYASGWDHSLLELSDVLPATMY